MKILQLAILGCAHGVVFFGIFHAKRYSISGGVSLLTRIRDKTLQLRATARDRRGGLPVAIAGTGSSAIIMRDMSLW